VPVLQHHFLLYAGTARCAPTSLTSQTYLFYALRFSVVGERRAVPCAPTSRILQTHLFFVLRQFLLRENNICIGAKSIFTVNSLNFIGGTMRKVLKHRFGFYAILTDPIFGYDYMANLLADNEIHIIQLRMKDSDKFKILKTAESIRKITENSKTTFIVNDFLDIAKDSGADGVHLGQGDTNIIDARAYIGDEKIIGLSTHNISQTKDAQNKPIDYIGIGPVYKTPTKDIPDQVLGLKTMKEMVDSSFLPSVCLGGIDLPRLKAVLKAGANNFSVVRLLNKSEEPKATLKQIIDIYNEFHE
jgi:thiamine-phosphate pyrophosphorylase